MGYIEELLAALLTLDIALAYHPHRDKDAVVRKTARRLRGKQTGKGREYIMLLIAAPHPHQALVSLHTQLEVLRP